MLKPKICSQQSITASACHVSTVEHVQVKLVLIRVSVNWNTQAEIVKLVCIFYARIPANKLLINKYFYKAFLQKFE